MNKVCLKVDGKVYSGWLEVSVRRSMRAASGGFDLNVTERWPGQSSAWPIKPGALCEVTVCDQPVITGYIDSVNSSYSANSHSISVRGRDKTADLIDCSADNMTLKNLRLGEIVRRLIKPFGIEFVEEFVSDLLIKHFVVQTGESVFQTIEKGARLAGVLLMSDGRGRLVATRASMAKRVQTVLRSGENILSGSLTDSAQDLYSQITVKSQVSMPDMNSFDLTGLQPAATVLTKVEASVSGSMKRYRPLMILAESQATNSYCRTRAEWEAATRLAASRVAEITVVGWVDDNGDLWRPNTIVSVVDEHLKLANEMLITDVAMQLTDAGSITRLRLVDPQAYEPQPVIVEKVPPSYSRYNLK